MASDQGRHTLLTVIDLMECDEPPRPFRERGLGPYERGPWPCDMPEFFLGVHRLNWLWEGRCAGPVFINVHLMLSKPERAERANFGDGLLVRPTPLQPARCPVGADGGGYTEIKDFGRWRWSVREHVWLLRRVHRELGGVEFCAPQDWPCAPAALAASGLTVADHMERTLRGYLDVAELAPELPWAPVLQGATRADYLRHVEAYQRAGVDLWAFERVLLGSIAAHDDDPEIVRLVQELQASGLALHGLGVKEEGIRALWPWLFSMDSLTWSLRGRSRLNNLRKALGIRYRDDAGEKVPKLSQAELCALVEAAPPAIRDSEDARLLLAYGRTQDLANCQAYAEHWRLRQLALFGGTAPGAPMDYVLEEDVAELQDAA